MVRNGETLTLESCIFSGNQCAYGGAAVHTAADNTTILGCTFFNNNSTTSQYPDRAIFVRRGTATLAGNLFYGNRASNGNVVYGGRAVSLGYNVSDYASGTTTTTSGFTFVTGDVQVTTATVNATTFKPVDSAALATLRIIPVPITPAGFPTTDFYGNDRSTNSGGGYTAAGAVAVENCPFAVVGL
ncbi:hypothetical protein FACS189473_5480 [Spirochaetia bacterium]|nr:hypothetical protein FACS189473_5480 [Spirochaetia bacterium]